MSEMGTNLSSGSIPELNASMCANCCCELNDAEGPDSAKISNRKPRATSIVVKRNSNVPLERIPISVILNSILLLPSPNPFTDPLSICMDCANIMAQIFGSWMALKNSTRSGAQLEFVTSSLKQFIQAHAKFSGWRTASVRPSSAPIIVSIRSLAAIVRPTLISAPQLSDQDHRPSSSSTPRVRTSPSLGAQIGQEHLYGKPSSSRTIVSGIRTPIPRNVPQPELLWVDDLSSSPTPTSSLEPETDPLWVDDDRLSSCRTPTVPRPEPRMNHDAYPSRIPIHTTELKFKSPSLQLKYESLIGQWQARPPTKKKENKPAKMYTHPPCPQCGKVFRNRNKNWLKKHIEFSHNSKSHIICDICGKPCQNYVQKATHAKTHMNQAEREACGGTEKSLCPECGKCVVSSSLGQHQKIHRNPELRRLKCKEEGCEYSCSTVNGLRRHENRIHSDKPDVTFKCVKCGESFRLYDLLKEHQMTTCEREDRPHVCIKCLRSFKIKPALQSHYLGVHKMTPRKARNLVYPKLSRRPVPEWVGKKRIICNDSRKRNRKRRGGTNN